MGDDPYALATAIENTGLRQGLDSEWPRGFAVWDLKAGEVKVSDPALNPLKKFLEADTVDYDKHEAMFFEANRQEKRVLSNGFVLLWSRIWHKAEEVLHGPSPEEKHDAKQRDRSNATRLCTTPSENIDDFPLYDTASMTFSSVEEYVRDGMRLATGMGRKSALAGLWAGGGKGVMSISVEDQGWRVVIAEPSSVKIHDFTGTVWEDQFRQRNDVIDNNEEEEEEEE
eukprot:jgi/Bigna1/72143/fgenesh1_pg.18_\